MFSFLYCISDSSFRAFQKVVRTQEAYLVVTTSLVASAASCGLRGVVRGDATICISPLISPLGVGP